MTALASNAQTTNLGPELAADFQKTVAKAAPELFGHALRMARSPQAAEDLVQDTVERAFRFREQYTPGTNLRAWLHRILFSVFVTGCRRRRRERNALNFLTNDPFAWTRPEDIADMHALSPPVARALDALPQGFRDVIVLVDIEEMAYKDAARRLRVPVGTVMSRLYRGRRLLAELMTPAVAQLAQAA
jgi:RNA polymerase sigma-70 factor (ECF subfamily)